MSTTTAANGYMIRLEVLKMAKEMAEQDYFSNRDAMRQNWEMTAQFAERAGQTDLPPSPSYPAFPTPMAIKEKANELYSFITTK